MPKQACLICNNRIKYVENAKLAFHEIREGLICNCWHSSWHERALVYNVIALIGVGPDIYKGCELDFSHPILGIGDSFRVQAALASKFSYTNTFLDQFPQLNLEDNFKIPARFEVVTCSDVLEHVFDFEKSIMGLSNLVREMGWLIIRVPSNPDSRHIEHYSGIQSYKKAEDGSITWEDSNGRFHHEKSPVFHGGDANTLETRVVGIHKLITELKKWI